MASCTFCNNQCLRLVFAPIRDKELAACIIHAADSFKNQVFACLVGQYGFNDIYFFVNHPDDVILSIAYEYFVIFINRQCPWSIK